MAGKGGGAWKVAYADFATAMMAFFLVMWITTQNKAVKESVAQYFENPLGTVDKARATSVHGIPGASAEAEFEGEQAGPHGTSTREKGTFAQSGNSDTYVEGARPPIHIFDRLDKSRSVGTMILFSGSSTELTTKAQEQLSELAIELRGKSNKVEIRGHAIQRRGGVESETTDAWIISSQRAMNTMKFLVTCGVERQRFRLSQDGSYEPYSDQGNKLEDPRNDRVEVWAIDELTSEFKPNIQRRAGNFIPAPPDAGHKPAAAHTAPAAHAPPAKSHGGH